MAPGGCKPAEYKRFEVRGPKERLIKAPDFTDKAVYRRVILMEDYSDRFDELRRNRVAVSRFKYGSARKNFKTGNVNAIGSMKRCLEKYQDTGNTEYLRSHWS